MSVKKTFATEKVNLRMNRGAFFEVSHGAKFELELTSFEKTENSNIFCSTNKLYCLENRKKRCCVAHLNFVFF